MMHSHLTHTITLQHTATYCHTLQPNVTHCNALQHTATLRHTAQIEPLDTRIQDASHRITLQQWITLQHTAVHCNTLQHICTNRAIWTHSQALQQAETHCNTRTRIPIHVGHESSIYAMTHSNVSWLILMWRASRSNGRFCSAALIPTSAYQTALVPTST